MIFTDDHWQTSPSKYLIHKFFSRIQIVTIEAEYIKNIFAYIQYLFTRNMSETHPKIQVIRVNSFYSGIHRCKKDSESIVNKLLSAFGSISGSQVFFSFAFDGFVGTVEDHSAKPFFLLQPRRFVPCEITD